MKKILITFAYLVLTVLAHAEVISMPNADTRVLALGTTGTNTRLFENSFVVRSTAMTDVIVNTRSVLNTGASSLDTYGNRVMMTASVLNKAGTLFCSDSFMSSIGALSLNGAISISMPLNITFNCRLNPGVYVLNVSAYNQDGSSRSARYENGFIDIR